MTLPRAAAARFRSYRQVVTDAPVSYSVYSAFSFYGARRGGQLPGTWLSAGLRALGHGLSAIRQTLYRMEHSEELSSRVVGRIKFYTLSPYARAEAEAGLAKIMDSARDKWDGEWTIVQVRGGTDAETIRERVREILRVEGFAPAGGGLFLHPRDRTARLTKALAERAAGDAVEIFRGRRISKGSDKEFVARHWDLESLAKNYEHFLRRYAWLDQRARSLTPRRSFIVRFAIVFDYLEVAWRDPDIVSSLLSPDWPGFAAQRLAQRLYNACLPSALQFADSLPGGRR